MSRKKPPVSIILHNVRSAENVGSIFRTADACGVSRIYLSGYTPVPVDRFGGTRRDVAKAALGAERSVPWRSVKNTSKLLARLKKENFAIVAVEQSPRSIDYKKFTLKKPTAVIFGNEVSGVPQSVLKHCDAILEIPMRGVKESLNVSVAAGIILSCLLNL